MAGYNPEHDRQFRQELNPQLTATRIQLRYLAERLTKDPRERIKTAGHLIEKANACLTLAQEYIRDTEENSEQKKHA